MKKEPENFVNFVKLCRNTDGGFGNFPGSDSAVDYTIAAVEIYIEENKELENKETCIKFLSSCQRSDGGFGRTPETSSVSAVDYTCSGVAALYQLGVYPADIKGCVRYINSCENPDGGYGRMPKKPSDMDSTVSAVAALNILGERFSISRISNYIKSLYDGKAYVSRPGEKSNVEYSSLALLALEICGIDSRDENLIKFVLDCQNDDGGYGEMQKRPSNIDYTYSALEILRKFDVKPKNLSAAKDFVNSCFNEDGGFGFIPGTSSKVEYTYYGISCIKYLDYFRL